MDNIDLSFFFKTKAQAMDFATRLSQISEKIYQTDFDLEKTLMSEFSIQKKDRFMVLLRESNVNVQSKDSLKQFLNSLKDKVAALPVLAITLAIDPKESTLKTISEWFIINTKKQVLLDVNIDPSLIAGATIFYSGRHIDCSEGVRFDQILGQQMGNKTSQGNNQQATTNSIPQSVQTDGQNLNNTNTTPHPTTVTTAQNQTVSPTNMNNTTQSVQAGVSQTTPTQNFPSQQPKTPWVNTGRPVTGKAPAHDDISHISIGR